MLLVRGQQVVSTKTEVNFRLWWPEADWSQTGIWLTDFLRDPLGPSGMLEAIRSLYIHTCGMPLLMCSLFFRRYRLHWLIFLTLYIWFWVKVWPVYCIFPVVADCIRRGGNICAGGNASSFIIFKNLCAFCFLNPGTVCKWDLLLMLFCCSRCWTFGCCPQDAEVGLKHLFFVTMPPSYVCLKYTV